MGVPTGEPTITINGDVLSPAQAAVVRIAIENLGVYLNNKPVLANSDLGPTLADAYRDRVKQLQRFMYRGRLRP
ncbi:hypothetical protein KPB04_12065 [Burkholderia cenocepacia]|uniref:hypothetical protein n=1 Tax=Burkholderia cenocepacia TaxID=95486 RepID=UPI00285842BF|nr:hypothetical protein [Burkholderia cenocepacia]MDR8102463.1 hypothetical protein [Burkholderia cenocepacia]